MERFYNYWLTTDLSVCTLVDYERKKPLVVNCINPHSFVTAERDPLFKAALQASDMLLPDGMGICAAVNHWKHKKIAKIAGDDFHLQLLEELDAKHGKVFYLGSTPEVLSKIAERLSREHPHISCATLSPSYCPTFSAEENAVIIDKIEAFAPDALLVGMTAPKQEKWLFANIDKLTTPKVTGCIGGAFEFYAGTKKRASSWAVAHGAEWLVRLLKDPRHMWRRNFISSPQFILYNIQHSKDM